MLKALDPLDGRDKWDFRYDKAPWAGTMSTSGGLVFAARRRWISHGRGCEDRQDSVAHLHRNATEYIADHVHAGWPAVFDDGFGSRRHDVRAAEVNTIEFRGPLMIVRFPAPQCV